jgi:hypothetical protein
MQSFTQPQRLLELTHEPGITRQAIFKRPVLIVGQSSDNVVSHPFQIAAGVYHFTSAWIERVAGAVAEFRVSMASPA